MDIKHFQKLLYNLPPLLLATIASVLTVAQIILVLVLRPRGSEALQWAGWICLWTAAIFGTLPIIIFRKKGGVPKGASYVKTTILVDSDIYAIVRHPQGGTAWLLMNLGVLLIAWHWTSAIIGLSSMVLVYADTFKADQNCIEKFGDAYKVYIDKVPRVNFVAGIIRLVRSRAKPSGKAL